MVRTTVGSLYYRLNNTLVKLKCHIWVAVLALSVFLILCQSLTSIVAKWFNVPMEAASSILIISSNTIMFLAMIRCIEGVERIICVAAANTRNIRRATAEI